MKYKLNDMFYVYSNGNIYKGIKCDYLRARGTFHDYYSDKTIPITIIWWNDYVTIYKGKFEIINGVLRDLNGEYDIVKGKGKDRLGRLSVRLMSLREILVNYPDCELLGEGMEGCDIGKLVYCIEYISSKTGKYKRTIINNTKITKLNKYIRKLDHKLGIKCAIIIIGNYDTFRVFKNIKAISI